jgi:hypothetical protein
MMQSAHDKVRKTVEIDTNLEKSIQEMADEKIWSFSQMAYVLLQQAVKEKNRKKKSATKEDHS